MGSASWRWAPFCTTLHLSPLLQVMEYCNMGSLGDAVSQGLFHHRKAPRPENLDLLAVLRSGAEIASALCYLHDGEITHGDLSGGPAGADQRGPGQLSSCAHFSPCAPPSLTSPATVLAVRAWAATVSQPLCCRWQRAPLQQQQGLQRLHLQGERCPLRAFGALTVLHWCQFHHTHACSCKMTYMLSPLEQQTGHVCCLAAMLTIGCEGF